MVYLPEAMPASFQATYTPVESAGTEAQIKHLSRLMATQMTAAGLGPGEPGTGGRVRVSLFGFFLPWHGNFLGCSPTHPSPFVMGEWNAPHLRDLLRYRKNLRELGGI